MSRFKRRLETLLDEKLGRRGAGRLFFDSTDVKKHEDFEQQLAPALDSAATLVVLLSDGYLRSSVCCDELRRFSQVLGGDPAGSGRVFLVPIDDVKREDWPSDFRDIFHNTDGYLFWSKDPLRGITDRIRGDDYRNRMNELRTRLAEQLKSMTRCRGPEREMAVGRLATAIQEAPTVCLAKSTPDLRKARDELQRYLASAKVRVLPEKPYPADPARLLPAFESDLRASDVFVQILGESYSDRSDELPEGEEAAQHRLAKENFKLVLQWRAKSVSVEKIEDSEHRTLVGGPEVISSDLAEFAMHVVERAKRAHEARGPQMTGDHRHFVLLKADKADEPVASELMRRFQAANINCRRTLNGRSMMEWFREVLYDVVLVICGSCSDDWLEKQGDELLVVDLNLKTKAPLRAYYVCKADPVLPYLGKDILTVLHEDKDAWLRLLEAIQRGANT